MLFAYDAHIFPTFFVLTIFIVFLQTGNIYFHHLYTKE